MTLIDASKRLPVRHRLAEYAEYREVLWHLALRDLKLRYRRTALGMAWAVLQPLLPMLILTRVFARVERPDAQGIPYSLYVLAALVPWSFFSSSVSTASMAFIGQGGLLTKVYFPRAILPLASVLGCTLDFGVGCLLLTGYALVLGRMPLLSWLILPIPAILNIALAAFISVGIASLSAIYRDVKHVVPFLMQMWLYATPVIYSPGLISEHTRWLLGLNPMTAVVLAFRACLFGAPVDGRIFGMSLLCGAVTAAGAMAVFARLQDFVAERV